MTKQDILDYFNDINQVYNDSSRLNSLSNMIDEMLETALKKENKYDRHGDLISREDLKKSMRKSINERYISWTKTITVADIATLIFDEIEYAPTVDTTCPNCDSGYAQGYSDGYLKGKEERPKGEWIDGYCSKCGVGSFCDAWGRDVKSKFCPNCGANMRKEIKNDIR